MSYDLAVWEGQLPESHEAAAAVYQQLMERLEAGEADSAPTASIGAYVDTLLARWPDITANDGEQSPWADGPLINNAFGDAIYFSMVWSAADEASAFAAQVAESHGLVCYDPQIEALRPVAPQAQPGVRRSWFRRSR
jgi:hypothetical protein